MSAHRAVRYARQMLLPEIGEAGQQRIEQSVARVAAPSAPPASARSAEPHAIAECYARRAGFVQFGEASIDLERLAPSELVRHPAPRAVLAGARTALAAIRRAVQASEAPDV